MEPQDMDNAYEQFRQAHAAGDTEKAQQWATFIKTERAKMEAEAAKKGDAIDSVAMHPVEGVADLLAGTKPSGWFDSQEQKSLTGSEIAGDIGGGMAAGAVGGAVLPGLLKGAGKIIPGPIGKLVGGLGDVAGSLPLKERVLRGAGGGAAMGGAEAVADSYGAPKAVKFGAGLAAGGVGETVGSFLGKGGVQLLKVLANAGYGNIPGVSRAMAGMINPNKELNAAAALKLQKKLFGEKIPNYIDNLDTSMENRLAVQAELRKADPSLVPMAPTQQSRAPWASEADGEMFPVGAGTDLAPMANGGVPPGFGPAQGVPPALGGPTIAMGGPGGASGLPGGGAVGPTRAAAEAQAAGAPNPLGGGFEAAKAAAGAKRTAAQKAQDDLEQRAAEAAMRPASAIYRERMFDGVTAGVREGKTFSTTPEYTRFESDLLHEVTMGNVPAAKAQELLRQLRLDRARGAGAGRVHSSYAEQVDNNIRRWGEPAEGAIATGADAIDSRVAADVRSKLRDSFNAYTERLGLGQVEKQYRGAYQKEMVAEAKDKLPLFLAKGLSKPSEFADMARNLAKDPAGKTVLMQALGKHLAQAEPKAIVSEFERLQSALVQAKLVTPAELGAARLSAEGVKRTADEGLKLRFAEQLRQQVLMAMTRQAGASGGGAVGAARGEAQQQREQEASGLEQ